MAFSLKTLASGMFSRLLLNNNFEKIEDKVNNDLVHRQNGSAQMQQDLDMNSNEVLNVNDPTLDGYVANKRYVDSRDNYFEGLSQERDTALQSNIDNEVSLRASEDVRYKQLSEDYTNTAVANALTSLQQELIEGDVKTVRYSVIAVEGQVSFTVPFSGFKVAEVFLNGVRQDALQGAYTVNGSVFTFAEPLAVGDVLSFILGIGYEIEQASNVQYETFVAEEGQSSFTLTSTPLSEEIIVFINGVKQLQNSFVINAAAVVFSSGLTEGDLVEVLRINRIQSATEYHEPIALFKKEVTTDTIIPASHNGLSVDPTIAEGVTVTVSEGSKWAIVGE